MQSGEFVNKSIFGRAAASLAIAAALATGLASGASAQVAPRAAAELQSAGSASSYSSASSASSYSSAGSASSFNAASCGFYFSGWDRNEKAYYNHCSPYGTRIRVRFSYRPFASYNEINVSGGVTNLTDHWELQGRGKVTYACQVDHC